MKTCTDMVKHYKSLPVEYAQQKWAQIQKKGVKGDHIREILMFYFQHKAFIPPDEASYNALLMTFSTKSLSKKMRNVIFQILDEVCWKLEGSIVETVCFSANSTAMVELLNCIMVGGFVHLLDNATVMKLFDLIGSKDLNAEECGKLLTFLCRVTRNCNIDIPENCISLLNQQLVDWLQLTSQKFVQPKASDRIATDIFTALSPVSTFSKPQIMGVHTFSIIKMWLYKESKLIEVVGDYCSCITEQCLQAAQKEHDIALQKAILAEVVEILCILVQLDQNQTHQCLQVVKCIQHNVLEKFKSDPRDISVFVRILKFYLITGDNIGYDPQHFFNQFLRDIVHQSYSSGLAAFEIATFILDNKEKLSTLQQPLLQNYFPNLLKLVACHPANLVEEYIEMVPLFVGPSSTVEVFHSLIDLPLLSAMLCVHQAPLGRQNEQLAQQWMSLLENVKSPAFRPVFSYIMRKESGKTYVTDKLVSFMNSVEELSTHPLVIACSEIVPLLLDTFFNEVESEADMGVISVLVPVMLTRLQLLFKIPNYQQAIYRNLLSHIHVMFELCPELVFVTQTEIIQFLAVLENSEKYLELFLFLIWAVGQYAATSYSENYSQEVLTRYYEALECCVYEALTVIPTQENVCLNMFTIICTSLAKLTSKCHDLIPRVQLCFRKIDTQMRALTNVKEAEKQFVCDRIEELAKLLRHPNIAATVLSPSETDDPALSAVVRILAQFADI